MAGSIFRGLMAFLAAGVFWGNLMFLVPTNPTHVPTWWKAGMGLALFVLFVAQSVWRAAQQQGGAA